MGATNENLNFDLKVSTVKFSLCISFILCYEWPYISWITNAKKAHSESIIDQQSQSVPFGHLLSDCKDQAYKSITDAKAKIMETSLKAK